MLPISATPSRLLAAASRCWTAREFQSPGTTERSSAVLWAGLGDDGEEGHEQKELHRPNDAPTDPMVTGPVRLSEPHKHERRDEKYGEDQQWVVRHGSTVVEDPRQHEPGKQGEQQADRSPASLVLGFRVVVLNARIEADHVGRECEEDGRRSRQQVRPVIPGFRSGGPLDPEVAEGPRQHIGGPRELKAREGLVGPMAELVTPSCENLGDPEAEHDRDGDLDEFEAVQGASPRAETIRDVAWICRLRTAYAHASQRIGVNRCGIALPTSQSQQRLNPQPYSDDSNHAIPRPVQRLSERRGLEVGEPWLAGVALEA